MIKRTIKLLLLLIPLLIFSVLFITKNEFNQNRIDFKKVPPINQNQINKSITNNSLSSNKGIEAQFDNIRVIIIEEQDADNSLKYDIEHLAKICKQEILELETYFNYDYPHLITVKLHNGSFWAYGHLYEFGGYAKSDERLIEFNLDSNIVSHGIGKHEFIHLFLAAKHGNSKSRLMTEGFAVAVEDILDGVSYSRNSINENLKITQKLDLELLINNENKLSEREFYPNAGRFVKWLIESYGLDIAENIYFESTVNIITIDKIANILNDNTKNILDKYNSL